MNKTTLVTAALAAALLAGCGSGTGGTENAPAPSATASTASPSTAQLTAKDGTLTATDSTSPLGEGGLAITIKQGPDGTAKFIRTLADGKPTQDYYEFNYQKNQVEKFLNVAAMGTSYYYIYDLTKGELVKVEDPSRADVSERVKTNKRWDNAATQTKSDVEALEKYFQGKFGKSIKQAVTEKA